MPDDDPVLDNGKRLSELKVVELKEELSKHGLSKAGNKNVLYERLKEYLTQTDEVTSSGGGSADESKAPEAAVNPLIAAYKSEQAKALKRARHDAEKVLNTSESDMDAASESANTSVCEPGPKRPKQESDKESTPSTKQEEDSEPTVESTKEEEEEEVPPPESNDSEVAEETAEENEKEEAEEMEHEQAEHSPEPESEQKIEDEASSEAKEDLPSAEDEQQIENSEEGVEEETEMVDVKGPKQEEMHTTDVEAESGSVSQEEKEESSVDAEEEQMEAEEDGKESPEDENTKTRDSGTVEESSEEADVPQIHSEEPESSASSPSGRKSAEEKEKPEEEEESGHNEDELDFDEEVPNGMDETEPEAPAVENVVEHEPSNETPADASEDTVEGNTRSTVDGFERVRAVSPARRTNECTIHIRGLTRPLTNKQMMALLSKYGEYDDQEGFWIDKVKSNCIVKYQTEAQAELARNRLHHIIWPAGNKNSLSVEFTSPKRLQERLAEDGISGGSNRPSLSTSQLNLTITIDNKDAKRVSNASSEARKSSVDGHNKEEMLARRMERFKSDTRERDEDVLPPAKKRKDDDDKKAVFDLGALFRRTEATPHIYYLPLTDEQIEQKEKDRAAKKSRPSR